jgi:hypothetical protein
MADALNHCDRLAGERKLGRIERRRHQRRAAREDDMSRLGVGRVLTAFDDNFLLAGFKISLSFRCTYALDFDHLLTRRLVQGVGHRELGKSNRINLS